MPVSARRPSYESVWPPVRRKISEPLVRSVVYRAMSAPDIRTIGLWPQASVNKLVGIVMAKVSEERFYRRVIPFLRKIYRGDTGNSEALARTVCLMALCEAVTEYYNWT